MEKIEERAYEAVPDKLRIDKNYMASFVSGYCQGAREQRRIHDEQLPTIKDVYYRAGWEQGYAKAHDWLMSHYREYFALRKPISEFEKDFINVMTTEK